MRRDGIEKGQILDLLTQLVRKSLIVVRREPGQKTRYFLLETIRAYALARLAECGEAAAWAEGRAMSLEQAIVYALEII